MCKFHKKHKLHVTFSLLDILRMTLVGVIGFQLQLQSLSSRTIWTLTRPTCEKQIQINNPTTVHQPVSRISVVRLPARKRTYTTNCNIIIMVTQQGARGGSFKQHTALLRYNGKCFNINHPAENEPSGHSQTGMRTQTVLAVRSAFLSRKNCAELEIGWQHCVCSCCDLCTFTQTLHEFATCYVCVRSFPAIPAARNRIFTLSLPLVDSNASAK